MPYELMVSWRYLRGGRRGAGRTIALAAFAALTLAGAALFAWSPATKATGMLLVVFGGIGAVAAALAHAFSAFTTVAILGVALGVRVLAVVLSVTTGFEREFKDKVLGVNAHVLVMKYGLDFSEYGDIARKAQQVRGVIGAAPFVLQEMLLAGAGEPVGVLLKGVDPARVGEVLDLPRALVDSRVTDLKAGEGTRLPTIFLGRELGRKVHAKKGDAVQLVTPSADFALPGSPLPVDAPRTRDFEVAGIFDAGFGEYDQRLAYVHIAEAQKLVGRGDTVTGVEMKVADIDATGRVVRDVEHVLADGPYRVIDWRELNHNLFAALRLQKLVLSLVMTLIVLVASFNVVATLSILVLRKTREFAILRAMGSSDGGIARVCRSAGLIIGAIGVAIGLGWAASDCALVSRYGYPLDPKVYLIGTLPVAPNAAEFALTAAVAIAISLLATLVPARRAASIPPVEGLRYE